MSGGNDSSSVKKLKINKSIKTGAVSFCDVRQGTGFGIQPSASIDRHSLEGGGGQHRSVSLAVNKAVNNVVQPGSQLSHRVNYRRREVRVSERPDLQKKLVSLPLLPSVTLCIYKPISGTTAVATSIGDRRIRSEHEVSEAFDFNLQ